MQASSMRNREDLKWHKHGSNLQYSMHTSKPVNKIQYSVIVALGNENLQAVLFAYVPVDILYDNVIKLMPHLGHFHVNVLSQIITRGHYGSSYVSGLKLGTL